MKWILAALFAVSLVWGITQQRAAKELKEQLEQSELARLELERENAEIMVSTLQREAIERSGGANDTLPPGARRTAPQGAAISNEAQGQSREDARIRMRSWSVQRGVKEVLDVLALEPNEQERLRDALDATLATDAAVLSRETLLQAVRSTLGQELGDKLRAGLEERDAQLTEQRIFKDVAYYSKALALTAEQESEFNRALRTIEEGLKSQHSLMQERMRGAMSKHFGGEQAHQELQRDYDEIQSLAQSIDDARIEGLLTELSGTLSDQQKNTLLELKGRLLSR